MQFRHIEIDEPEYSFPVPEEFEFDQLQALTGVALPESFAEFIRVAGGCSIARYGFKIAPHEGTFAFPDIYSLRKGAGGYRLIRELQDAREAVQIPDQVIPFACAFNGPDDGVLYLDLTDEGAGCIVAWAAGKPAWTGWNTASQFLDVADSFDEYIELLRLET